jgi:hypothetical protein
MKLKFINHFYVKILPWLATLLLAALIFVLHLKELTPKSFISVLKYKYYGYTKPEINKIKFIFYLQNEDVSEVNFYGHRGGHQNGSLQRILY